MDRAHSTSPLIACSVWLGIDLGARNSRVAKVRSDGQVQLITTHSGDACVDHNFGNPPLSDTSYQQFASYDRDSGSYWIDDKVGWISQLDVIAEILGHLRSLAVEDITQGAHAQEESFVSLLNAVIAVPAYSGHNYRCLVAQAAHLAGFDAIRIINRSTCAMLAYRKDALSGRLPTPTGRESLLALLSLNARSIEASVYAIRPPDVVLIWSQGSASLGGDDFIAALVGHVIQSYGTEVGQPNPRDYRELWEKCEKAVIELSRLKKTQLGLSSPFLPSGTAVRDMDLSRESFWSVCEPVYQRVEVVVAAAFSPFKERISHVAMVGGASLLCHLKERVVAKHVGDGCTFIPPSCFVPQESIAVGAALKAYFLDASSNDRRVDPRADVSDYAYNPVHLLSRDGQTLCVVQPCERIPTSEGKEPSFLNEERYRLIQSRDAHAGVCGELRLTTTSWVSFNVNELGQITVKCRNCKLHDTNSSNLMREKQSNQSTRSALQANKVEEAMDSEGRTFLFNGLQLNDKIDIGNSNELEQTTVASEEVNSLHSIKQSPGRQRPTAKRLLFRNEGNLPKSPIFTHDLTSDHRSATGRSEQAVEMDGPNMGGQETNTSHHSPIDHSQSHSLDSLSPYFKAKSGTNGEDKTCLVQRDIRAEPTGVTVNKSYVEAATALKQSPNRPTANSLLYQCETDVPQLSPIHSATSTFNPPLTTRHQKESVFEPAMIGGQVEHRSSNSPLPSRGRELPEPLRSSSRKPLSTIAKTQMCVERNRKKTALLLDEQENRLLQCTNHAAESPSPSEKQAYAETKKVLFTFKSLARSDQWKSVDDDGEHVIDECLEVDVDDRSVQCTPERSSGGSYIKDKMQQLRIMEKGPTQCNHYEAKLDRPHLSNAPVSMEKEFMSSDDETATPGRSSLPIDTRLLSMGNNAITHDYKLPSAEKPSSATGKVQKMLSIARKELKLRINLKTAQKQSRHCDGDRHSSDIRHGSKSSRSTTCSDIKVVHVEQTPIDGAMSCATKKSTTDSRQTTTMSSLDAKCAIAPIKDELRVYFPLSFTMRVNHPVLAFYTRAREAFSKSQVSMAQYESVEKEARCLLLLGRAIQRADAIIEAMKTQGPFTKLTFGLLQNDSKFIARAEEWRARLIRTIGLNDISRCVIAERLREFTLQVGILVKGHARMSQDGKLKALLDLTDFQFD